MCPDEFRDGQIEYIWSVSPPPPPPSVIFVYATGSDFIGAQM
jgi:hypothetical protein